MLVKTDPFQERIDLPERNIQKPREILQVVIYAHPLIDAADVRDDADLLIDPFIDPVAGDAEHFRLPGGGAELPCEDLDSRGLACPAGTEETEDLAFPEFRIYIFQHKVFAELFGKMPYGYIMLIHLIHSFVITVLI